MLTNLLILENLKKKIKECGGPEVLKKAIVWQWWKSVDIKDERDFDAAIDECYRCYVKAEELRRALEDNDEISANFFS